THLPSAVSILLNSLPHLPVAPSSSSLSLFFFIQRQMHSHWRTLRSQHSQICSELPLLFTLIHLLACLSYSIRYIIDSTLLLYVIIIFGYDRLRYKR
ncbi:hypothetical protein M405DRAFT_815169, partial [Rhizopogon salebrosus TDB-379]